MNIGRKIRFLFTGLTVGIVATIAVAGTALASGPGGQGDLTQERLKTQDCTCTGEATQVRLRIQDQDLSCEQPQQRLNIQDQTSAKDMSRQQLRLKDRTC
jgi:hypothetical protein